MTKIHYTTKTARGINWLIDNRIFRHNMNLAKQYVKNTAHPMAVFAHDYIGASINQFGVFEGEELDILFDFLEPLHSSFRAGTALDIGANIGNHSIYFADHFRTILAFEPNPTAFALLSFNTTRR